MPIAKKIYDSESGEANEMQYRDFLNKKFLQKQCFEGIFTTYPGALTPDFKFLLSEDFTCFIR